MIGFIIILAFIFAFLLDVRFRYFVFHMPKVTFNAVVDLKNYIKYKKYNNFDAVGQMVMYIACEGQPFGSGKTLNLVDYIVEVYNKYNGLLIYDKDNDCFVEQHIKIYSNIFLRNVPYIQLTSEQQIIEASNNRDNSVVNLFVLDEIGSQFNNRNWKNNLSSDLLSAILQQRKAKISILGTVQDFSLFDATLRKLTAYCIVCRKSWRFLVKKKYLCKDIERADGNSELLTPLAVSCGWATDRLYNSYDTTQKVLFLQKEIAEGEHLNNDEILVLSNSDSADLSTLTNVRRRFRKRVRK